MTTPTPTPTPEEKFPQAPAIEVPRMGFFNRVRRELKSEEEPIHPSEEAEIVIMEEDGDAKTRF